GLPIPSLSFSQPSAAFLFGFAMSISPNRCFKSRGRADPASLVPHAKPATERIGIVAGPAMRRQRLELLDVASPDHGLVGLERRDQAFDHVGNVATPLLLAMVQ